MTITREDLVKSQMRHTLHLDGSDYYQNHYANTTWPRLTCIVERPRGHRSKVQFSKRFYVDGVEVFTCSGLLERLNKPKLAVVTGNSEAAA